MEEKPLFKFKKASRSIGGFDVNSKDEYDLLIKKEYQDFTKFTHIHKMWNIVETPDETDADGNINKKGKKSISAYQVTSGFIKDGNHIVTSQKTHGSMNYTTAHKSYIIFLDTYINERGYIKDVDNYQNGVAMVPKYFANEKTSMEEVVQQQTIPIGTANNPPKNKKLHIMKLLRAAGIANNNPQIQP